MIININKIKSILRLKKRSYAKEKTSNYSNKTNSLTHSLTYSH